VIGRARRVRLVLAKDLRLGPRSPLVLWAMVLPIALTLLLNGVLSGLLDPKPRLGVVADSEMTSWAEGIEGIRTTRVASEAALQRLLRDGRLDAGVITSADFEAAVVAGEQPPLNLLVSGASSAPNRGIIISGLLGAVRQLASATPPVDVIVVRLGEPGPGLEVRVLPLLVILAVAIAGGMVPAASLVEEKEHHTLHAVLVTPVSTGELLLAKGLLGWLLAVAAGVVTLAVNGAFGAEALATLLAVGIGALMMAEIGLLLGAWAHDTNTLFAAWKVGALALFFPVAFFLWPGMPAWVPRLGPTYYFLRPIYAVSVEGAAMDAVAADLAVGAGICAVLAVVVVAVGRRLGRRIGQGRLVKPSPA
jgi:ABC-2 type transport system permease protein